MTPNSCTFFAIIDGLELPDNFDRLKIEEGFYLSSSENTLKSIISDDIAKVIGLYSTSDFFKKKCFIYYDAYLFDPDCRGGEYLKSFLNMNILFCQALWLCKDNAVMPGLGYLKFFSDSQLMIQTFYTNALYSNHKGCFDQSKFTTDELNKAVKYLPLLLNLASGGELNPYTNLHKNVNRIARALLFMQSARISPDLGSKVAHYCSCFESLFSISTVELKHRLSETIAFFLESESLIARDVYEDLKLAYDLRSLVVHGSIISSKYSKNEFELLIKTVENCDNYIRLIIQKIMSNQNLLKIYRNGTDDDLSNHLIELIFKK
jgi:hypothetical protein